MTLPVVLGVGARDATFRKMANRNQTDTNEIATTEIKYQTDFHFAEKIAIFNQILRRPYSRFRQDTKKRSRTLGQKYQIPIWYWYFLGIPIFLLPIGITSRDRLYCGVIAGFVKLFEVSLQGRDAKGVFETWVENC